MEFSVVERLALLQVPPPERGRLIALKLVREFREALSFSDEEVAALNVQQQGERITWNSDADKPKDITIGSTIRELLLQQMRQLDQAEQLPRVLIDFCERIGYTSEAEDEEEENAGGVSG